MGGGQGMVVSQDQGIKRASGQAGKQLSHRPIRGLWLALALGGLLTALPVVAQSAERLSDAWQSILGEVSGAVDWGHAVATRRTTLDALPQQQARLTAELDTLVASTRLAGHVALGQGLAVWRRQVSEASLEASRTPGRHDLPWIAADLRRDLPLEAVAIFGFCRPPRWVEVWHYRGITRVPWRSRMTLGEALSTLSDNGATAGANRATLITPLGERQERGIAAWNREPTGLAPGARVMLQLPEAQGLRAALPFPGTVEEAGWVNQALPAFLATRMPGEECRIWDVK